MIYPAFEGYHQHVTRVRLAWAMYLWGAPDAS